MKNGLIILVVTAVLSACSYHEDKGVGGNEGATQGGEVPGEAPGPGATEVNRATYQWIDENIVKASCLRCHGEGADIELHSYERVLDWVTAGAPDQSDFYTDIESGRMPKRKPKLDDEKIQAVKEWILAGALNN